MSLPIVEFAGVSKRYVLHHERSYSFQETVVDWFSRRDRRREDFWALRDVSFDVQPGESVGLIGPNGSGKSTTLKLIARIIEPTGGHVTVRGGVGALLELGAGFHPDLSGRDNIYLSGSILGLNRARMQGKIDAIIDFSGIGNFIDVPVRLYSSGMFVRLGFAVAVHLDTEILLIDEVLAVGDAAFQRKCIDTLVALRQSGRTMIVVSHDLNAIRALCGRTIQFERGCIQAQGPTDDVIRAIIDAPDPAQAAQEADHVDGLPTRIHFGKTEMTPVEQSALGGGWHTPEDTHTWTTRRAQVNLHIREDASRLCLEVASMRPPAKARPLPVQISIDDGPPETIFLVHVTWQTVCVNVPPQARGHAARVTLDVERVMVPDLCWANDDRREVGIAVSRLWQE